MAYIESKKVAEKLNLSVRRIQQMCKSGEIIGAKKIGRSWFLPSEYIENNKESLFDGKKQKPLPIGISDFKKAITEYYYVDKKLLIKDFLDTKPQVSLFTRPRRFGKTLSMDMLRVFFEKTNEDTSHFFKNTKIWNCKGNYMAYQGQYPVIFFYI